MSDVKIIAEVGSVHDGSFGNAKCLIRLAAECGADVVKFQTHISSAETLVGAPMPSYFKGEPRYEYFERTGFSINQWRELSNVAAENNIEFLSSPFSIEAVDLLTKVGISSFKIASGEVSNTPMIRAIALTGKPVLISSGMSNWDELDRAVNIVRAHHENICIMQCSSMYPCPPEFVGLNVLREMQDRWGLSVGYSDHSISNNSCYSAVTLGARVIEKHLTFSRSMYGSDASNAAEPDQFADLVKGVREISRMLDNPIDKDDISGFREMKKIFEKSVVSRHRIPAGTTITADMITTKKPGDGIPAAKFDQIVGMKSSVDIPEDTKIKASDIE